MKFLKIYNEIFIIKDDLNLKYFVQKVNLLLIT